MEALLRLLPVLACPIVMGLAMWMMMRGTKTEDGATAATEGQSCHAPDQVSAEPGKPAGLLRSAWMMVQCCLNWKVLAALAVAGAGVWVVAPGLVASVLPLLLVLVCPISMLLMMRNMSGANRTSAPTRRSQLPAQRVPAQRAPAQRAPAQRAPTSTARLDRSSDRLEIEGTLPEPESPREA